MGAMASQITSLTIVYSTVYSDTDQRKHQSSTSLAFVRGIRRWPVNSLRKRPVTRKMLPFDDVIMSKDALMIMRRSDNTCIRGGWWQNHSITNHSKTVCIFSWGAGLCFAKYSDNNWTSNNIYAVVLCAPFFLNTAADGLHRLYLHNFKGCSQRKSFARTFVPLNNAKDFMIACIIYHHIRFHVCDDDRSSLYWHRFIKL